MNKKIAVIYNSLPMIVSLSDKDIKQHKITWGKLGSKPNLKWYRVYSTISGNNEPSYITETEYYNKIELILNNRTFSEAYCDKNFYHNFIDNHLLPDVYLRNMQGVYYTRHYKHINLSGEISPFIPDEVNRIIIKKSIDSGGGRGIQLFNREGNEWKNNRNELLTVDFLENNYNSNFLIQEYIEQHQYFSHFNKTSVNTVRVFTYRSVKTNEIIPIQSVLRIGLPGAIVDNQAAGGIACGINKEGKLNNFAINKKGEKLFEFNGIDFTNTNIVYKFHEIIELSKEMAQKFYYHRLLGFDFTVDMQGNIKLIEVNNRNNEINFYQMNNGPLFKEYTNEIIDFCLDNKINLCFDFEV